MPKFTIQKILLNDVIKFLKMIYLVKVLNEYINYVKHRVPTSLFIKTVLGTKHAMQSLVAIATNQDPFCFSVTSAKLLLVSCYGLLISGMRKCK